MKTNKTANDRPIAVNKRANHEYFIDQRIEAGLVLEGLCLIETENADSTAA